MALSDYDTREEVTTFETQPYYPARDNVGFFETFGKSIVGGFLNVAKGITGTAEELYELLPGVGEENFLTKWRGNIMEVEKQFQVTPDSALEWGASVLGQALPYMGAALTGHMFYGAVGSAAVAFAVEGQDAYDAAKARGASENEANVERGLVGAVNAAIEAWQIGRIMDFSKAGKASFKVFKEAAKNKAYDKMLAEGGKFTGVLLRNSIEEALEESLQEGVSIFAPSLVEGREALPIREDGTVDTGAILDRVGQAALAGAVISPFLGATKAFIPAIMAPSTKSFDIRRAAIQGTEGKSEEWKAVQLRELDIQQEKVTGEPVRFLGPVTEQHAMLDHLDSLVTNAKPYEFGKAEKEEMSKKRGAKRAEAKRWAEENKHLVNEGRMTEQEFAITVNQIGEGSLKQEFDIQVTNELDNAMYRGIRTTIDPQSFDWPVAQSGWNKLSRQLVLPEASEIDALEPVIGKSIADKFRSIIDKRHKANRSLTEKLVDGLTEMVNFPRAIVASFDMSFLGRQGLNLFIRHPVLGIKATVEGWKSFLNEENLEVQDVQRRTHPNYDFITKVMKVVQYDTVTGKEHEYFASKLAKKLPGIKASERGYTSAGNDLRFNVSNQLVEKFGREGLTTDQWEDMGSAINHLSGHGDAKSLKKLMPVLNFLMFSPRYNLAHAQLFTDMNPVKIVAEAAKHPKELFSKNVLPAQKMIAGTLMADVMFSMGVLYLLSLIKGVEVERDPQSTDFGKIKIGDTRFEFFGDSHRITRLAAQLLTGKSKNVYGDFSDVDRTQIVARYLQSKASPIAALAYDYIQGENFLGEPLEGTPEGITKQIYDRMAPIFIQDMVDYIHYNNLDMDIVYAAPLAFHGVTTLTYPVSKSSELTNFRNLKAQEFYGDRWENIGPEAQKYLTLFNPVIEELELQANQEKNNKAVNTKFMKEQRNSEKRLFNNLSLDTQKELNKLLVDVGGFNRVIADGWYLNDQRYLEYQSRTAQEVKEVLPLYLDMDLDPMWKRMLIEDVIDNIKEQVRREIVFSATMKDLTTS